MTRTTVDRTPMD